MEKINQRQTSNITIKIVLTEFENRKYDSYMAIRRYSYIIGKKDIDAKSVNMSYNYKSE